MFTQICRSLPATLPLLTALLLSASVASAQCPAVGNDTNCGTVITIVDGNFSISSTGQGPYGIPVQGSDFQPYDTLVGVFNNSSQAIYGIGLSSILPIFQFSNDGIDAYGIAGNSSDNTGYGGPNAYFSNIDPTQSIGNVNFITPIPPGGTGYFSLAAALSSYTSCSNAINYAVSVSLDSSGQNITGLFTPNNGFTLTSAAQACGFSNFNWQQLITNIPSPSPYYDANFNALSAPAPFNDPPEVGYPPSGQEPVPNAVGYPFYYNLSGNPYNLSLASAQNTVPGSLYFFDAPADPCLFGGSAPCGSTAPAGSFLAFSTHLVGIVGSLPNITIQDTGIGFAYTDTFNGTNGGIAVLNSSRPVDSRSGTGGITITSINNVSTYQYPKALTIKTINGKAASQPAPLTFLTAKQISSLVSPFLYVKHASTYDGVVVLRNTSNQTIEGPFQLVLLSLTNGVRLNNGTGNFGNAPFVTVPRLSKLEPGEFAFVIVEFSNPSSAKIRFSPALYTGGFN